MSNELEIDIITYFHRRVIVFTHPIKIKLESVDVRRWGTFLLKWDAYNPKRWVLCHPQMCDGVNVTWNDSVVTVLLFLVCWTLEDPGNWAHQFSWQTCVQRIVEKKSVFREIHFILALEFVLYTWSCESARMSSGAGQVPVPVQCTVIVQCQSVTTVNRMWTINKRSQRKQCQLSKPLQPYLLGVGFIKKVFDDPKNGSIRRDMLNYCSIGSHRIAYLPMEKLFSLSFSLPFFSPTPQLLVEHGVGKHSLFCMILMLFMSYISLPLLFHR